MKHYRIETSFMVAAHNEKQALLRWREFQEVLNYLCSNEWHAHDIVRYVTPGEYGQFPDHPTPPERLTLLGEQVLDRMPQGGIAPSAPPEEIWLDPYSDDDYDPIVAANQIFFAETPDEEDTRNYWPPLELTDDVCPDGVIRPVRK